MSISRSLLVGVLAAVLGALTACATVASTRVGSGVAEDRLQFRGEVRHIPIEGGFWGIVAEDGRRFDPGALPPEFRRAGVKVEVSARPVDRVSFRQWGTPIEVLSIRALR